MCSTRGGGFYPAGPPVEVVGCKKNTLAWYKTFKIESRKYNKSLVDMMRSGF